MNAQTENAQINIKPQFAYTAIINGETIANVEDAISLIENATAAGYTIRLQLKANGYRLTSSVEEVALTAAGLSGFAAAKQAATGIIEINF